MTWLGHGTPLQQVPHTFDGAAQEILTFCG
jgi:hypothetical protein